SPWLEALVARLLAKSPADRFQSAAEVAALLEGYLGHLRQPATIPAPELPTSLSDSCLGLAGTAVRAGVIRSFLPRLGLPALLLLLGLGLALVLLAQGQLPGGGSPEERVYDFRGRSLPPDLKRTGPLVDSFINV